jgi:hypothetical protein
MSSTPISRPAGGVSGWCLRSGRCRVDQGQPDLGARFAQDRGHFLLSGEFHDDQSGDAVTSRGWFNSSKVMANPNYTATNGQHRYLLLPGVGLSQSTVGGLITSGPLANTQFNAAGQPVAYTPGLVSGLLSAGATRWT